MTTQFKAKVDIPPFWPVDEAGIAEQLATQQAGELVRYGTSIGGRDLCLLRYPNPGAPALWVVGCVHGHEAGTTAACFNLLNIKAEGVDLKGKPWPDIAELAAQLDLTVVPVANPDARARCADCFVGWPAEAIVPLGQSLDRNGKTIPVEAGYPPGGLNLDDVLFLGGLYNEQGLNFTRQPDMDTIQVTEVRQLLAAMEAAPPQCCVDLHACSINVLMMVRNLPESYREKVRRIRDAAAEAIKALGHQFTDEIPGDREPVDTGFISYLRVVHQRFGALAFVYEGRQGYINRLPHCDAADIVDDYLILLRETMRLGVAEGYLP